jgi:hypothetical protein
MDPVPPGDNQLNTDPLSTKLTRLNSPINLLHYLATDLDLLSPLGKESIRLLRTLNGLSHLIGI